MAQPVGTAPTDASPASARSGRRSERRPAVQVRGRTRVRHGTSRETSVPSHGAA
jgi:hypothetical protein